MEIKKVIEDKCYAFTVELGSFDSIDKKPFEQKKVTKMKVNKYMGVVTPRNLIFFPFFTPLGGIFYSCPNLLLKLAM